MLAQGKCYTNRCGPCGTGRCAIIPNGASSHELYCLCTTGLSGDACYGFDCHSCGGVRAPDNRAMMIVCACPDGLTVDASTEDYVHADRASSVAIILPLVCVGLAVIAAVVTTVLIIRHEKQKDEQKRFSYGRWKTLGYSQQ